MYKLFSRYVKARSMAFVRSPYACLQEYCGTIYGFWVRPTADNHYAVADLMEDAVSRTFAELETNPVAEKAETDKIVSLVFKEWAKSVVAFHEESGKTFTPDIFKGYGFEMQLIIVSDSGCTVKKYDMNGNADGLGGDKKLKTDNDLVTVSLSRADGFYGECLPQNAGIICFRDKEAAGDYNTQNRYIYDWRGLMVSIAANEIAGETDAPTGDNFDGSFLLAVDMDKLENYLNRQTESRPYVTVRLLDEGKFGFYAETGKVYFKEMELIEGTVPSDDAYLEIKKITEDSIELVVNGSFKEDGGEETVLLKKGETKTLEHQRRHSVDMTDGEFEFTKVSRLELNWDC